MVGAVKIPFQERHTQYIVYTMAGGDRDTQLAS